MTEGEHRGVCPNCGGEMKPTGEGRSELRSALGSSSAEGTIHWEKIVCAGEGCRHTDWWAPPPAERRAHPRFRIPQPSALAVAVGIIGARPFRGTAVDISRGGLSGRFETTTRIDAKGRDCFLRFTEVGEELSPHSTVGSVRRVETRMGHVLVAIEFADPLERLDLPRTWKT